MIFLILLSLSKGTKKRRLRSTSSQRKKNSRNIVSRTTMDEKDFLFEVRAEMEKERKVMNTILFTFFLRKWIFF